MHAAKRGKSCCTTACVFVCLALLLSLTPCPVPEPPPPQPPPCFSPMDSLLSRGTNVQCHVCVTQPRFALVNTVDLRRMNLGAMGSSPDLLLQLFQHCRHITTLNLWGTYLEVWTVVSVTNGSLVWALTPRIGPNLVLFVIVRE